MRRKKQRKSSHINESWLLPYSDLLTLLVALFIVLFAMSEIDVEKYEKLSQVFNNEFSGGQGIFENSDSPVDTPKEAPAETNKEEKEKRELTELEGLQKRINNYIEKSKLSEVLGTKLTDEGLLITILNNVSFDPASAKVKEEGRKIGKEVSKFLSTDPPHQIVVSGHTDDRPIHNNEFSSNWELSVMRAVNFMSLLLHNDKLDPKRFAAKGFGEQQSIVPNTSEQNRAKNRRVEVLILPNYEIKTNE